MNPTPVWITMARCIPGGGWKAPMWVSPFGHLRDRFMASLTAPNAPSCSPWQLLTGPTGPNGPSGPNGQRGCPHFSPWGEPTSWTNATDVLFQSHRTMVMSWHLEVQGDPFAISKMRNLRLEKQLQPTNCWMTLDEKMLAFAFLLTFPVERILKCHIYLSLENGCYGSKIEDAGDHRFTIQVWGTIPEGQELDLEDEECGTSEVFVIAWLARLALESDQRFPVAMQMWPSGIAVFKSGLASRIVFDVFVPRFTLGALLAMGSGPRSVETLGTKKPCEQWLLDSYWLMKNRRLYYPMQGWSWSTIVILIHQAVWSDRGFFEHCAIENGYVKYVRRILGEIVVRVSLKFDYLEGVQLSSTHHRSTDLRCWPTHGSHHGRVWQGGKTGWTDVNSHSLGPPSGAFVGHADNIGSAGTAGYSSSTWRILHISPRGDVSYEISNHLVKTHWTTMNNHH